MAVENRVPLLIGHLLDHVVPGVTGVVDDDVDAAKAVHGGLDVTLAKVRCADVAVADGGFATQLADYFSGLVSRVGVQVVDHDARAFARQFQRDLLTDATTGTGDHCDFAFEFCHGVLLLNSWVCLQSDDGVANNLGFAILIGGAHFDLDALFAIDLEAIDDSAGAGDLVAQVGNAEKAHAELAQLTLIDPLRQQAAEVGHRQHSVGEHVGHAGPARVIGIDVNGVVIPRRAGKQAQRGAVDRRQGQWRQGVADVDFFQAYGIHQCSPVQPLRCTSTLRRSATCSPC
ncbi:hypothetical protein EMIT0P294_220018 [Pseudomonas sp. IT-P294]